MLFGSASRKLERYVASNPDVSIIVVCGQYGRRSAMRALATLLSRNYRVTIGYNNKVETDIAIIDFSALDNTPQIEPDLVVITSCDDDAKARQFFEMANHAACVAINYNDVSQEFAKYLKNPETITYGDELPADYYFENHDTTLEGCKGDIVNRQGKHYPVEVKLLGEHNLRPVVMAAAVARLYDISREDVLAGVKEIRPLNGRMSPAKGLRGSIIIDDSANNSDPSVKLAMRAIYALDAPSRIVVLDNSHIISEIDQDKISQILVLGPASEKAMGDKVKFFSDRLELINYLASRLEEEAIVLTEIPLSELIEAYIW